ncbi:hypothetical protein OPV22_030495 [Ensete ventricosum]|uniref:Cation/H+ exchanger domain-containing protein n=1 Tax=Ensete ventricosum TaxID=4639 RepID=A0AAV8QE54_ENSVE|nr:hypothetical protein OPV22_030495 [Ensete ventricosum]
MDGNNTTELITYCYRPDNIVGGGVWQSKPFYSYSLPVLLWQMVLMVAISRSLAFPLKPLRQPRVIAEILGGVLLGPTGLGKITFSWGEGGKPLPLGEILFPPASYRQLEAMSTLGITYYLFLIGAEFDIQVVAAMRKKVVAIATVNMAVPIVITVLVAHAMNLQPPEYVSYLVHVAFIGAAMGVTAFPVLVRLLAELKLLNDELGQLVVPPAALSELMAWVFLAGSVLLPSYDVSPDVVDLYRPSAFAPLWIMLSGIGLGLICWLVVLPIMDWTVRRTPEGEAVSDAHITIVATGVLAAGLIADVIGFPSVLGAFVFGLLMPQGALTTGLRNKLEDFVVGLLLPIYFGTSGFKANTSVITMDDEQEAAFVAALTVIMVLCFVSKLGSNLLIAHYYSVPASRGLSLGLLMNTKGSIEMIILNIGKQKRILDERTYTMLVLGSILMTAVVGPALEIFNKTTRSRAAYKRRNLQQCRPDSELRMVACVYTARNVPSIISLLRMSNPTKRSPVFVYVVHLLELTGRGAAMMIVHQASSKHGQEKVGSKSSGCALQADQIIAPFQSYEQQAGSVSVQRVTAVSPYSTMHEDIFNIAEERHTTIIVLPFHRLQSVAGDFEEADPAIRSVNMNVLAHSPCTVCILVDRGLSGVGRSSAGQLTQHHVAVLFFGGPDDREALTYSSRMAEHPGVILTVIRFLPGEEAMVPPSPAPSCASGERAAMTAVAEANMQRQLDDECTNLFRLRHVTNDSVTYTELVINNIEETVTAVRAINGVHSMYVVGRGKGMESSPLLAGLTLWSEYPELGPIGDMLLSADFGTQASVLVVQQYVSGEAVVAMESTAAQESPKPDPVQRYLCSVNHKAGPGRFNDVWMPGV